MSLGFVGLVGLLVVYLIVATIVATICLRVLFKVKATREPGMKDALQLQQDALDRVERNYKDLHGQYKREHARIMKEAQRGKPKEPEPREEEEPVETEIVDAVTATAEEKPPTVSSPSNGDDAQSFQYRMAAAAARQGFLKR